MFKSYKYRIYPNKKQQELFEKTFGCVRFYWNKALEIMLNAYEENKNKQTNQIQLMQLEIKPVFPEYLEKEFPFLKEVDSLALHNERAKLEEIFNKFINGNGKKPSFKSKKTIQSYKTNNKNNSILLDFERGKIRLPKIGDVKAKLHRKFNGIVRTATIIKTSSNKYFVSILVQLKEDINKLPPTNRICAIDVGLKDYAVIVDNEVNIQKIPHPKWITSLEKRIIKAHRQLKRKNMGSNNREKQRIKVAKLKEKLRCMKEDFLHKLSNKIIRENKVIIIENIDFKSILSNKTLSKHIHHSSWGRFFRFLEYKAKFYGRKIIKVDKYYPSSKLCNVCGYKNEKLTLSDREWKCDNCGTNHDRDINAALNLLKYGLACLNGGRAGTARTQACGDCNSQSVKQEATVDERSSSSRAHTYKLYASQRPVRQQIPRYLSEESSKNKRHQLL